MSNCRSFEYGRILILLCETVSLALSVWWYIDTCSTESLIALVGAFSALIASLVLKHKRAKADDCVRLNCSHDNIIIQGNRGNIKIHKTRKDETD